MYNPFRNCRPFRYLSMTCGGTLICFSPINPSLRRKSAIVWQLSEVKVRIIFKQVRPFLQRLRGFAAHSRGDSCRPCNFTGMDGVKAGAIFLEDLIIVV